MLQDLPLDPKSLLHSSQLSTSVAKPSPKQILICSDNGGSLLAIITPATINPEISERLAHSGTAFHNLSEIIFGY